MRVLALAASLIWCSTAYAQPDECWFFGNDVGKAFIYLRVMRQLFPEDQAVAQAKHLAKRPYLVDLVTAVPDNVSPYSVQWSAEKLCRDNGTK